MITVLSGCASFSERPPFPTYLGPVTPMAVTLAVSDKSYLEAGRGGWTESPISGGLAAAVETKIWESGWVQRATESGEVARLRVDLTTYQAGGPGLLSIITVFVIPGVIDHHVEVEVDLAAPDTPARTCRRSVDMRTWYQTLLIVAYPIRSPAWGRMKSAEALALTCLAELLERGRE